MPTVSVYREDLSAYLGHDFSDDEYRNLFFDYGLELDEITSAKQILAKEHGEVEISKALPEDIIFKIDVPANRYDLLCLEGIGMALKVYLERMEIPKFVTKFVGENTQTLKITENTASIRPYAVAVVLRNVTIDQKAYNSFIELQEKLHFNLGRRRAMVAIGAHDLDTIQGPFVYDAKPPTEIKFKPLNHTEEVNGLELMELYSTHPQLKQYLHIIQDSAVFPVITDANGVVLSLPPIINGDHSKITLNTKNIFIECTATDLKKVKMVLDTLVCMFSGYCDEKFTVEECIIENADGTTSKCPNLNYREVQVSAALACNFIGIRGNEDQIPGLLCKMSLPSLLNGTDEVVVKIPPTRHDIMHACDVYEDIAIAYGYNNIPKMLPSFMHIAEQFPLNQLTELLRQVVAQAGFTEALTFTLLSKDDSYAKVNKNFNELECVQIKNPKSSEFQVVRPSLLPGLLKTIAANKKMPLPLKIFEVSDVVLAEENAEVGARNERRLCAVNCNKNAGFEVVHGLLDKVMSSLEVSWKVQDGYRLEEGTDPSYFPGRYANIMKDNKVIGKIGVLHPIVLHAFEVTYPCAAVELNIEMFL